MSVLICGSLAYDTIMVFQDRFKNHILPDQVHILNVSFFVPNMRREWGGCAGNISYNLKLLGGEPYPMATVGQDFGPYSDRLDSLGISQKYVTTLPEHFSAQAFITTDLDDNQITAFHPGAMSESHRNQVKDTEGIELAIVAPDSDVAMIQHADQMTEMGIPFVFDPGQAMPLFDGEQFRKFIEQANWVTVNDYESQLLKERTGWTDEEIAQRVEAYLVTRGPEGAVIYFDGTSHEIPAAKAAQVKDPTGCGDAFRAGLLYGLQHQLDWPVIGRIATLMGCIKVEAAGTQNHTLTMDAFRERYEREFGSSF